MGAVPIEGTTGKVTWHFRPVRQHFFATLSLNFVTAFGFFERPSASARFVATAQSPAGTMWCVYSDDFQFSSRTLSRISAYGASSSLDSPLG